MQVNVGLAPVAGYQWEQTIGWLCALSMAHVCARCSGSWVWKARVSGRRWLNDTTYCPNSHSGSCAPFPKEITREETRATENRLCPSVTAQGKRYGSPFDLLLMPLSGLKLDISVCPFNPAYVVCFCVGTSRRDASQQETGHFPRWPCKCKKKEWPYRVRVGGGWWVGGGGLKGTKTGQGRAAHIFPPVRFYARLSRLTGNALHSFHENVFSFTGNVLKKKKKKRLENRAVVDGRARFLLLFLPKSFHYSLRRRTLWRYPLCQLRNSCSLSEEKRVSGASRCSKHSLASRIVCPWNQRQWFRSCSAGPLTLTTGRFTRMTAQYTERKGFEKKQSPEPQWSHLGNLNIFVGWSSGHHITLRLGLVLLPRQTKAHLFSLQEIGHFSLLISLYFAPCHTKLCAKAFLEAVQNVLKNKEHERQPRRKNPTLPACCMTFSVLPSVLQRVALEGGIWTEALNPA